MASGVYPGTYGCTKGDSPSIANSLKRTQSSAHELAAIISPRGSGVSTERWDPEMASCFQDGEFTMELDILMANIAKAGLAGLALVLLGAPIRQAKGKTNASLCGSVLEVTGQVKLPHAEAADEALEDASGVVAWLVPAQTGHKDRPAAEFPHYRIVQRDKTFRPRLLVIPAGSTVDFPNNDRWLHNVFSISRVSQFDLGLYEAGVLRSVRFNRAGVSYLFCSIHPEMMAVVVTVDSTYFGVSDKAGRIAIENVPPGQYFLHVWRENATPQGLRATRRLVFVGADHHSLPAIYIPLSNAKPTNAKNWMQ